MRAGPAAMPPPTDKARPGNPPNSIPPYPGVELAVYSVQVEGPQSNLVRRRYSGRTPTPNQCTGLYLTRPRMEPAFRLLPLATAVPSALERAIALEPVTVTDDGPGREVVFVQGHEPGAADRV